MQSTKLKPFIRRSKLDQAWQPKRLQGIKGEKQENMEKMDTDAKEEPKPPADTEKEVKFNSTIFKFELKNE